MTEKRILIKPIVKVPDAFAEQLLVSMIAKGLNGQELLDTFKQVKNNVGWTIYKSSQRNDPL